MSDQDAAFGYADAERRYRLDGRIATGGMGEVWRATDTVLGRAVAVKLLKSEYADDAGFRARFETEARHAASLLHPSIAAVYDFGEAPSADGSGVARPFLVMELVDGSPLSALLRPGEPLDPDAVRELLAQAADGLGAAHEAGIVHRDIKPANLLVTPDREVKITDFGIARAAEGLGLTRTGEVMGTPQYISPEQAQGSTATPASDVYSLGVVAFEALAGHRPFVAESAVATALAHIREPVPALPDSVPTDLEAVVRRAMAKLPQDRFPDGAALAAALRDPATAATALVPPPDSDRTELLTGAAAAGVAPTAVAGTAPETAAEPVAAASGARRRRGPLWLALGAIALAIAAVAVFFMMAPAQDGGEPDEGPSRNPGRSPAATSSDGAEKPSEAAEPTTQVPTSEPTTAPTTEPTTPTTPTTEPTSEPPSPTPTQTTQSTETTETSPTQPSSPPSTSSAASSPTSTAPSPAASRTPGSVTPSTSTSSTR